MNESSSKADPKAGGAPADRRAAERYFFSEAGEILDVSSGARLKVRIADISMEGCYMDTMNPFPVDTLVRVTIRRNGAQFISAGAVRNSQQGMGMGIVFAELAGLERTLLGQWIGESASPGSKPAKAEPPKAITTAPNGDLLVRRLIELLRKKGQLSDAEIKYLFRDAHSDTPVPGL
jgi:hypothetical protein